MTSRTTTVFALWILVLISSTSLVITAPINGRWNNARDYDAIVITGEFILRLNEVPIKELYLYAYNSSQNIWEPIPFQIDEKDDSSHYWLPAPNHVFDYADELVFMAKDMGDRAPDGSYWIDDPGSKDYERIEITATDPLTNNQAWAYIYRSKNSLPLATKSYMDFFPDSKNSGADTMRAETYIQADTSAGIPTMWKLLQGTGVDILDRQKVKIMMKLYGFIDFPADESLLQSFFKKAEKKVGPVRILREVFWHIDIGMGIEPFDFSLPLQYYPFSIESGGVSGSLKASDHVYYIRQSFDLKPAATGMKFYNPINPNGVTIDGTGGDDGIKKDLYDAPAVNWWLITGNQGSYAITFRMSPIGSSRKLYYKDDKTKVGEGLDTGDRASWGDTGIEITGTDIAGRISFAYKAYYLAANQPYARGQELAQNFETPLQILTQPNFYIPVELTLFTATESEGKVHLEWLTATETNNYGFEVQRKTRPEQEWQKTGFVSGNGTSVVPHKYSFVDANVALGTYYYRLKQIDFDGNFEFSNEILIEITAPKTFSLAQNYPNPFNPETMIRYQIPDLNRAAIPVELKIYDLLGHEIRTLVQTTQDPGYHAIIWDGKNNHGVLVANGAYIYRLKAGNFITSRKMLLLR